MRLPNPLDVAACGLLPAVLFVLAPAAVPSAAVPSGAVPSGAVPSGAVPGGAVPSGERTAVPAPVDRRSEHVMVDALALADAPATLALDVARGGSNVTLQLERRDVRAAGFTLRAWLADGATVEVPAQSAALYAGTVDGDPERPVVASVRPSGVRAWVVEEGRVAWRLAPAARARTGANGTGANGTGANGTGANGTGANGSVAHVLHEGSGLPLAPEGCGFALPATSVAGGSATVASTGPHVDLRETNRLYEATCQRELEIAFDADFEYFQLKNSSVQDVADEIEAYVGIVDLFYARDLRVTFRLTDVLVRTAPFYAPTSGGSLLDLFRAEWNANQAATPRDVAHLMTGKPGSLIEYGGLAYVSVACNLPWAYGWSMDGANILGHEVGHNLGSGHCLDVDPCNTMCGACFYVGPNTKDVMNAYLAGQGCLDPLPYHPTPVPPYAYPDRVVLLKIDLGTLTPLAIDVTANDDDGNCEPVAIEGFDATTARGGSVTLGLGTAPDGRDEAIYTPPPATFVGLDTFEYSAGDGTGLASAGTVTIDVRPLALAAYWPFDDGAGASALDATVHGRHGTLAGPIWTAGLHGGALDFDGVNDHVDVPALNLDGNRVTFTAWIRRDGAQTNWSGLIVSRDGTTLAGLHFGLDEELRYTWNNEPNTWGFDSGLVPTNGLWEFVALVVEPHRATLHMHDGVTLQSAVNHVAHEPEAFDGVTRIGWNPSASSRRFDGAIDDVRVYGYALDPTEIDALARLGGPAALPRPVDGGLLPFADAPLTWLAGFAATSHDVYIGTDEGFVRTATNASPEFLGNQVGTSRLVGNPQAGIAYFWRVDERTGTELVPGQVWQFELARAHRWRLDEIAGTTALDAQGAANGTYAGAPGLGQPGATTALGSSVDFDGVDDRVTIPALNLDTDRATFTAWVRRDGAQAPWAGLVFSRAGNTTAGLNFGEADELRYHWNGGNWGWSSGLVVPDAQWVFVALVVEPSRATIFMHDGAAWQSAVDASTHTAEEFDGALQLGWDQGFGSRRFDGRLDDVRVFRAALSASELEELRAASL